MRREDYKMKDSYKMKDKKMTANSGLSSEKDIVQSKKSNYKARYSDGLSPEKEIVEGPYKPTYNSRYK